VEAKRRRLAGTCPTHHDDPPTIPSASFIAFAFLLRKNCKSVFLATLAIRVPHRRSMPRRNMENPAATVRTQGPEEKL
jgi:hypothetical protein